MLSPEINALFRNSIMFSLFIETDGLTVLYTLIKKPTNYTGWPTTIMPV